MEITSIQTNKGKENFILLTKDMYYYITCHKHDKKNNSIKVYIRKNTFDQIIINRLQVITMLEEVYSYFRVAFKDKLANTKFLNKLCSTSSC